MASDRSGLVADRRLVSLVVVLGAALAGVVVLVSFGSNTACTNAWSCTSPDCRPCLVVSVVGLGGLVAGTMLGTLAVFGPGPQRLRRALVVLGMPATAALVVLLSSGWSAPPAG